MHNFVSSLKFKVGRVACQYNNWLRSGRSGHRIPVGARFSAPVQTGPGAHPASCTMCTGSFPGVKSDRCVTLTHHSFQCRGHKRVELYLYSPYGPYGLYRDSAPLQGCTLPHFNLKCKELCQMIKIDLLCDIKIIIYKKPNASIFGLNN
jgi:hypothetical protein